MFRVKVDSIVMIRILCILKIFKHNNNNNNNDELNQA